MPRTPRLDVSRTPATGSVGRLNVRAPIEAFGGGEGLARAGQGLANLGKGLQDMGEAQDRKREMEARKREEAEAKKNKLLAEQALLRIDQSLSRNASELKRRKGNEAFGITENYTTTADDLIKNELKGFNEEDRAMLEIVARRKVLGYEPGIFSHERTEIERVDKINAQSEVNNYMSSAMNDIGILQGYNGSYRSFLDKYESGLRERVYSLADKSKMPIEAKHELENEYARKFQRDTASALLANLSLDESTTLEQFQQNVDTFKDMVEKEADLLAPEDKRELFSRADTMFRTKEMRIKQNEARIEAEETRVAIEDVSKTLESLQGASEAEQAWALKISAAMTENPRVKKILGKLEGNIRSTESKQVGIELQEMRAADVPISDMRKYLVEKAEQGLVSREDYPKYTADINKEIDSRVKSVVSDIKPMVRRLLLDNKKLAEQLPGGYLTEAQEKKIDPSVAYQRAATLEMVYANVERYLEQHPDKSANDGLEYAKKLLIAPATEIARGSLYDRMRREEIDRKRKARDKGVPQPAKMTKEDLQSKDVLFKIMGITEE